MTRYKWADIEKDIVDKPKWNVELYKKQTINLAGIIYMIVYNDGSFVDRPQADADAGDFYVNLKRKDMKSVSLIQNGKPIYTMPIKDDKLIIRLRNLAAPNYIQAAIMERNDGRPMDMSNPKRVFILATEGKIVFFFDDGDIDELTEWGNHEPYSMPELMEIEKW